MNTIRSQWYLLFLFAINGFLSAQTPDICGENPEMTSFCVDACVICDIDGFTGINDLTAQGQGFGEFCTTEYNNMQYISFIAGSVDLTIKVDVSNCIGGLGSLEVGFFKTDDCENFEAIMDCDTDILSGESQTFSNYEPLLIGQHYYLVIDGSMGANCNWTFTVLEGTTEVLPLVDTLAIDHVPTVCPDITTSFVAEWLVGAAFFNWTVDGVPQSEASNILEYSFDQDGIYTICSTPANACDVGPESCTEIIVQSIEPVDIVEDLCEGDCLEVNGMMFCETGIFQEVIQLNNGCDSVVNLNLTVHPQAEEFFDVWICDGNSFDIGTTMYTETGSYLDTVLTSNFCDSIIQLELLVIECEIIGIGAEEPAICFGEASGTIIFSIEQGTPPLSYTYANIGNPSITGMGTTDILTDNIIDGLPAGIYQIYVQDEFGNDVVFFVEVTEPPILNLSIDVSDYGGFQVSCFESQGVAGNDGWATANVSGGVSPYQFLWSDTQNTQTAVNLEPHEYTVTVTDDFGCTIEETIVLTSPPPLLMDASFNDPSCDGLGTGSIQILDSGGGVAPYSYSLDGVLFTETFSFDNLEEGAYTVHIQDDNGCVLMVQGILVAPDIPEVWFDDTIIIDLGDSTQLFPNMNNSNIIDIEWTPEEYLSCTDCPNPFVSSVHPTEYTITVMSIDSCFDTASIRIEVNKRRRVYIPNVFSPNNDGVNEFFYLSTGPEVEEILQMSIFDRWGNKVFVGEYLPPNLPEVGWNGFFLDQPVVQGTYMYMVDILFIDGHVEKYSGDVTVVR